MDLSRAQGLLLDVVYHAGQMCGAALVESSAVLVPSNEGESNLRVAILSIELWISNYCHFSHSQL